MPGKEIRINNIHTGACKWDCLFGTEFTNCPSPSIHLQLDKPSILINPVSHSDPNLIRWELNN